MKLLRQLRNLFRKRALDAEMAEEIRLHLEMQAERNRAGGMNADEARYAAQRQFGNVAIMQERVREGRGWVWVEQAVQDFRYAFRQLGRSPVFAIVAVATLAFGIGASTVFFSVVNAVFLRTLPVGDPAGLHLFTVEGPEWVKRPFSQGYHDYFRQHAGTVRDVASMSLWPGFRQMTVAGDAAGNTDELMTLQVSGNYFAVMGVRAALGRVLLPSDDRPEAPAVAVISHALWVRRFGSDSSVIGREILLDRFPVVVVGVATPGFEGTMVGARPQLWLPVQLSSRMDQNQPWGVTGVSANYPLFNLLARLAPGVSPEQANAELTGLLRQQLAAGTGLPSWQKPALPGEVRQSSIALQSIATGYGGARHWLQRPLALLCGMLAVVLLVACANIAGLLLVRGSARAREFALRAALGAGRGRVMRQLLVESLALASLGGAGGVVVAWLGTREVGKFLEGMDLAPDGRVLTFAVVVTAMAGLFAGFLPAWRLSRLDLMSAAKGVPGGSWLGRGLVILQIGLAFVLCSAATLIVQTFRNVAGIDTGFRPQQLLAAPLVVPRDMSPAQRYALEHQLREACLGLPGVRQVTFQQGLALVAGTRIRAGAAHEIRESPAGTVTLSASRVAVGPDFFSTMGIPVLHGSGFGPDDGADQAPARAVLDERAARGLFGEGNAIGRRISLWKEFEVIGVVADAKITNLREEPKPTVYLPRQAGPSTLQTSLMIRTEPGGRVPLEEIRALVHRFDPHSAVSAVVPVDDILSREVRTEKLLAQLASGFALFVLLLTGLGLFGLLAFNVARRTHEIGVRLALGASREGLLWLVVREGLLLVLMGSVIGIAGAVGLARFVGTLLYGVSPTEIWVYGVVALTLGSAALLACWLPARRAARVDPVIALRAE